MDERANFVAVLFLGVLAVAGLVGMVAIEVLQGQIPPSIIAITSTCIGVLGGMVRQPSAPPLSGPGAHP